MITPDNDIGPLWPPPTYAKRRPRWVVPTVAGLAALALLTAAAAPTWALTRPGDSDTSVAAATDTTPQPTPTVPPDCEREIREVIGSMVVLPHYRSPERVVDDFMLFEPHEQHPCRDVPADLRRDAATEIAEELWDRR